MRGAIRRLAKIPAYILIKAVVADDEIKSQIYVWSHTFIANVGDRSPNEAWFVRE
jgi:hypothetical protein